MEDILASIRRILAEEEGDPAPAAAGPLAGPAEKRATMACCSSMRR